MIHAQPAAPPSLFRLVDTETQPVPSARRDAGVIVRPSRARFPSAFITSAVIVVITTAYHLRAHSTTWSPAGRLRLIAEAGYAVHNLGYPSRTVPLAELGPRWLAAKIAELGLERAPRLHFVTHSMGGLMVRGYLAATPPTPATRPGRAE